jgi:hypothetical protein
MSTAPSGTSGTVSLADEDAVRKILIDALFGLWATINNLSRLRPSRRERCRVTVFGSARTAPGHWVYDEVKQMCAALAAMNCDMSWRTPRTCGSRHASTMARGRRRHSRPSCPLACQR